MNDARKHGKCSTGRCRYVPLYLYDFSRRVSKTSSTVADSKDVQKVEKGSPFAEWKNVAATRLRHGWSKNDMNKCLKKLTDRTFHFGALCNGLIDLRERQSQKNEPVNDVSIRSKRFSPAITDAARHVYRALSRSCGKHDEHQAKLNLEIEESVLVKETQTQWKFVLGLAEPVHKDINSKCELTWLQIESLASGKGSAAMDLEPYEREVVERLTASLTRCLDVQTPARLGKSVGVNQAPENRDGVPFENLTEASPASLSVVQNLCDLVHSHTSTATHEGTCLGLLKGDDDRGLVIHILPAQKHSDATPWTSLRDFLKLVSEQSAKAHFFLTDRLHMARQLANAVLAFYSTPWLKSSWGSNDIFLVEPHDGKQMIHPPHLQAKIWNLDTVNDPVNTNNAVMPPDREASSKEVVVNLGIILLELAHFAPFESLRKRLGPGQSSLDEDSVKSAICEFSKSHHTDMSWSYHKIAEELIEGREAKHFDLRHPASQAEFYERVVCKLDHLEHKLRRFHAED